MKTCLRRQYLWTSSNKLYWTSMRDIVNCVTRVYCRTGNRGFSLFVFVSIYYTTHKGEGIFVLSSFFYGKCHIFSVGTGLSDNELWFTLIITLWDNDMLINKNKHNNTEQENKSKATWIRIVIIRTRTLPSIIQSNLMHWNDRITCIACWYLHDTYFIMVHI